MLKCTAGSSYILLYPNGDVYRCMRDYNTLEKPMYNLKEENYKILLNNSAKECNQIICNTSCDSDWSSKFAFKNNDLIKKFSAVEWGGVAHKGLWKDQHFDEKPDHLCIIFTPTLTCNYSCSYCGCAAGVYKRKNFQSSFPEMNLDEWVRVFDEIKKKYKKVHIQTNGGEPFLNKATFHVIKNTSKYFSWNISSNISVGIDQLIKSDIQPFDRKKNTGFQITASMHPTTRKWDFDKFMKNLLLLKKKKYLRGINFVGWPGQIYDYEQYKKIFNKHDIEILLQPWVGPDNDGKSEYSKDELNYLNKHSIEARLTNNQLNFREYIKIPNQHSTCKLISKTRIKNKIIYELEFTNSGSSAWLSNDDITYGCKILENKGLNQSEKSIIEYRQKLTKVEPGEKNTITFEVDLAKLTNQKKTIIFDVLKEGKYWFSQLNSNYLKLDL